MAHWACAAGTPTTGSSVSGSAGPPARACVPVSKRRMPGSRSRCGENGVPPPETAGALIPTQDQAERVLKRILLNDYCGHPFQVELSRELARRGHEVLHVYSADDQTPKGDLLPHRTD